MDNIGLEIFEEQDIGNLQKMIYDTIDVCYKTIYPDEAVKFFKDYHNPQNIIDDSRGGYTIVLKYEDNLIGTGTLVGNEIKRVFVHPGQQKKGLGKIIMDDLEKTAFRQGYKSVKLDSSLVAKKFYDWLGYVTVQESFIPLINNQRLDYYQMMKTLS